VTTIVGLISDTHGLLRPSALEWLQGSDAIVHAGDIGDPSVLDALRRIAPLTAVRGNNDRAAWADGLPESATLHAGSCTIHVVHDIATLAIDPAAAGVDVVVVGHSHQPQQERRGGVLFVNPGSAGPRRFKLPISAARLRVHEGGAVDVEFVQLV